MSCQWTPYLTIWHVSRFYLVPSVLHQVFIQVQELVTTEQNLPCSARVWSRAVLANITRAKEFKDFFSWLVLGLVVASAISLKVFDKFLIMYSFIAMPA